MERYEIFYKNEKTAEIEIRDHQVLYLTFTDDMMKIPFCFQPNLQDIERFFESRCIPKNRTEQMAAYLESIGVATYDPKMIIKKTHGVMWEDFLWIKTPEEHISWEDVKIRG